MLFFDIFNFILICLVITSLFESAAAFNTTLFNICVNLCYICKKYSDYFYPRTPSLEKVINYDIFLPSPKVL